MKPIFKMTLTNKIKLCLFFNSGLNLIKALALLVVPVLFATSKAWIQWLVIKLPISMSSIITNSQDVFVSIFSVLAGAYITLYATYALKQRESRQKIIASKELSFYVPFFKELLNIKNYYADKKVWYVEFEDRSFNKPNWIFWKNTQSSLVKYSIPHVFFQTIKLLDGQLRQYMKTYYEASFNCRKTAIEITEKYGLVDRLFQSGYTDILTKLYLNQLSEDDVRYSAPNNKNIDIDYSKILSELKEVLLNGSDFLEFKRQSDNVTSLIEEVYDGIDYILRRISKKYKGMNILL